MVGPCSLKSMLNPYLSHYEVSCQTICDGKVKMFSKLLLLFSTSVAASFDFYFLSIFTVLDILQVDFLMESLVSKCLWHQKTFSHLATC